MAITADKRDQAPHTQVDPTRDDDHGHADRDHGDHYDAIDDGQQIASLEKVGPKMRRRHQDLNIGRSRVLLGKLLDHAPVGHLLAGHDRRARFAFGRQFVHRQSQVSRCSHDNACVGVPQLLQCLADVLGQFGRRLAGSADREDHIGFLHAILDRRGQFGHGRLSIQFLLLERQDAEQRAQRQQDHDHSVIGEQFLHGGRLRDFAQA